MGGGGSRGLCTFKIQMNKKKTQNENVFLISQNTFRFAIHLGKGFRFDFLILRKSLLIGLLQKFCSHCNLQVVVVICFCQTLECCVSNVDCEFPIAEMRKRSISVCGISKMLVFFCFIILCKNSSIGHWHIQGFPLNVFKDMWQIKQEAFSTV